MLSKTENQLVLSPKLILYSTGQVSTKFGTYSTSTNVQTKTNRTQVNKLTWQTTPPINGLNNTSPVQFSAGPESFLYVLFYHENNYQKNILNQLMQCYSSFKLFPYISPLRILRENEVRSRIKVTTEQMSQRRWFHCALLIQRACTNSHDAISQHLLDD